MLIVFGGLPGTGKTTISRVVADRLGATHLRIDAIEQAIRRALGAEDVGSAGYAVANVIAEANLPQGRMVVADCVNPVRESREAWRGVAMRTRAGLMEIEVICSDQVEHRRRVEARQADLPGHQVPSWRSVMGHDYEAWATPRLIVDTARLTPEAAAASIISAASLQNLPLT